MGVDFGKTARDYAAHRAGFPKELFDRLAAMGIGRSGQRLLDLGTGTGTLARGFARRGASVVGIDPSEPMLVEARRMARDEGVQVDYRVGRAEDIDAPDGAFDVVTAGQCWHWFDRPAAAAECMRVLVPGGALAICYFDWLPMPGNVVAATEALILRAQPRVAALAGDWACTRCGPSTWPRPGSLGSRRSPSTWTSPTATRPGAVGSVPAPASPRRCPPTPWPPSTASSPALLHETSRASRWRSRTVCGPWWHATPQSHDVAGEAQSSGLLPRCQPPHWSHW